VWTGTYDREMRGGDFMIKMDEVKDAGDAKSTHPLITVQLGLTDYKLEPQNQGLTTADLTEPPFTGGLMMALYQYKRFLTLGPAGSERDQCAHAGVEPVYFLPLEAPKDPKAKTKLEDYRVWAEVIRTEHGNVPSKWYFYRSDLNPQLAGKSPFPEGALIAGEVLVDHSADPCELYFGDFKEVGGKTLAHRMEVRNADKRYAVFNIKVQQLK